MSGDSLVLSRDTRSSREERYLTTLGLGSLPLAPPTESTKKNLASVHCDTATSFLP